MPVTKRHVPGLPGSAACRRKFLHFFPGGFSDVNYLAWERNYKWTAHQRWEQLLNQQEMEALLRKREFIEIAKRAVQIESRTNLLFSFEKMALRDAVRSPLGARLFASGLHDLLHGHSAPSVRFDKWCETLADLPRRQTRVLTWPLATVVGFIAQPRRHFFVKPMVSRLAAAALGYPLTYQPRPSWQAYTEFLRFARRVREDLTSMRPRDMIDVQSYIWVQGSNEYD